MTLPDESRLDRTVKRNLLLLASCQAIGQSANIMILTVTALAVVSFYPNRDLATLPITMQHFGVMSWVFPAALVMQWRGRKFGFRVGSVFGMVGASISGYGLYSGNFPLMCLGGFLLGYAVASLQMYRFAAMELAPFAYRARAVSWVTAGGVVAGLIGPSLVQMTFDQLMPIYLATYAGIIGIHIVVFTIMSFIGFPPMHDLAEVAQTEPPRSLAQIIRQPRYVAAVIACMTAYGTMSFVMGASPLAIVGCGLPRTEVQWVILLHVMGMFVPSFFTGRLIERFGVLSVMLAGTAILLTGIVVALIGLSEWNFRISLALNGIGWNFVFVGSTVVVASCYRPSERGKAQALNDFMIFGTTATASFFAGLIQERLGWISLNQGSTVLIVTSAMAVLWLTLLTRRDKR